MKFNLELMREILLRIEDLPAGEVHNGAFILDGYDWREANAHAKILADDGWFVEPVTIQNESGGFPRLFVVRGLSMKGHDYLANIRNNTVWKKLLAKAQADGVSMSTTVVSALATGLAKKFVGIE